MWLSMDLYPSRENCIESIYFQNKISYYVEIKYLCVCKWYINTVAEIIVMCLTEKYQNLMCEN
jgi:hypothetical protein